MPSGEEEALGINSAAGTSVAVASNLIIEESDDSGHTLLRSPRNALTPQPTTPQKARNQKRAPAPGSRSPQKVRTQTRGDLGKSKRKPPKELELDFTTGIEGRGASKRASMEDAVEFKHGSPQLDADGQGEDAAAAISANAEESAFFHGSSSAPPPAVQNSLSLLDDLDKVKMNELEAIDIRGAGMGSKGRDVRLVPSPAPDCTQPVADERDAKPQLSPNNMMVMPALPRPFLGSRRRSIDRTDCPELDLEALSSSLRTTGQAHVDHEHHSLSQPTSHGDALHVGRPDGQSRIRRGSTIHHDHGLDKLAQSGLTSTFTLQAVSKVHVKVTQARRSVLSETVEEEDTEQLGEALTSSIADVPSGCNGDVQTQEHLEDIVPTERPESEDSFGRDDDELQEPIAEVASSDVVEEQSAVLVQDGKEQQEKRPDEQDADEQSIEGKAQAVPQLNNEDPSMVKSTSAASLGTTSTRSPSSPKRSSMNTPKRGSSKATRSSTELPVLKKSSTAQAFDTKKGSDTEPGELGPSKERVRRSRTSGLSSPKLPKSPRKSSSKDKEDPLEELPKSPRRNSKDADASELPKTPSKSYSKEKDPSEEIINSPDVSSRRQATDLGQVTVPSSPKPAMNKLKSAVKKIQTRNTDRQVKRQIRMLDLKAPATAPARRRSADSNYRRVSTDSPQQRRGSAEYARHGSMESSPRRDSAEYARRGSIERSPRRGSADDDLGSTKIDGNVDRFREFLNRRQAISRAKLSYEQDKADNAAVDPVRKLIWAGHAVIKGVKNVHLQRQVVASFWSTLFERQIRMKISNALQHVLHESGRGPTQRLDHQKVLDLSQTLAACHREILDMREKKKGRGWAFLNHMQQRVSSACEQLGQQRNAASEMYHIEMDLRQKAECMEKNPGLLWRMVWNANSYMDRVRRETAGLQDMFLEFGMPKVTMGSLNQAGLKLETDMEPEEEELEDGDTIMKKLPERQLSELRLELIQSGAGNQQAHTTCAKMFLNLGVSKKDVPNVVGALCRQVWQDCVASGTNLFTEKNASAALNLRKFLKEIEERLEREFPRAKPQILRMARHKTGTFPGENVDSDEETFTADDEPSRCKRGSVCPVNLDSGEKRATSDRPGTPVIKENSRPGSGFTSEADAVTDDDRHSFASSDSEGEDELQREDEPPKEPLKYVEKVADLPVEETTLIRRHSAPVLGKTSSKTSPKIFSRRPSYKEISTALKAKAADILTAESDPLRVGVEAMTTSHKSAEDEELLSYQRIASITGSRKNSLIGTRKNSLIGTKGFIGSRRNSFQHESMGRSVTEPVFQEPARRPSFLDSLAEAVSKYHQKETSKHRASECQIGNAAIDVGAIVVVKGPSQQDDVAEVGMGESGDDDLTEADMARDLPGNAKAAQFLLPRRPSRFGSSGASSRQASRPCSRSCSRQGSSSGPASHSMMPSRPVSRSQFGPCGTSSRRPSGHSVAIPLPPRLCGKWRHMKAQRQRAAGRTVAAWLDHLPKPQIQAEVERPHTSGDDCKVGGKNQTRPRPVFLIADSFITPAKSRFQTAQCSRPPTSGTLNGFGLTGEFQSPTSWNESHSSAALREALWKRPGTSDSKAPMPTPTPESRPGTSGSCGVCRSKNEGAGGDAVFLFLPVLTGAGRPLSIASGDFGGSGRGSGTPLLGCK